MKRILIGIITLCLCGCMTSNNRLTYNLYQKTWSKTPKQELNNEIKELLPSFEYNEPTDIFYGMIGTNACWIFTGKGSVTLCEPFSNYSTGHINFEDPEIKELIDSLNRILSANGKIHVKESGPSKF